jgi:hypothetical protein
MGPISRIVAATAIVVTALTGDTPARAQGPAACNNQPNMAAALQHLRAARSWLERAEHNKGGWRARAIQTTDKAIAETERGCAVANGQ